MTQTQIFDSNNDEYASVRKKGVNAWIAKHVFHGSNKWFALGFMIGVALTNLLSGLLMIIIGFAIDDFRTGLAERLGYYTILIILVTFIPALLNLFSNFSREVLAQRIERDVRREFFTNLLHKNQSFFAHQKTGDLMSRTTDDVRQLNFLISPALSLIIDASFSLFIPILYVGIFYPPELLVTPILFTICFIIALKRYIDKLGPVSDELRMMFGDMNAILSESLSGIEVVKGSVGELKEIMKYNVKTIAYRDAFVKRGRIEAKYIPLLLIGLTTTFGLVQGVILYLNGALGIGQVIAYVGLLLNLQFPTFISIWVFAIVKLALSSSERLLEIMNQKLDFDEFVTGKTVPIQGKVEFRHVTFSYTGSQKPVLKNISFSIAPGQTVAIVGTTGSGKTTLTKLLSRLYDVNQGDIYIDNINIKDFNIESLRSQISFIEQDVFLFSQTIYDNIAFGLGHTQVSEEKIVQAAKDAQAHDFITHLPQQYYTEVGERGVQLSGGERQRIAIARAFLTDPKILILDDSTSAIDSETEDKIQQAISRILRGRTCFLITHRLSQIRWADLILVMKRGEIIAHGRHNDLIQSSEEYRNIFLRRFDLNPSELQTGGS